MKSPLFSVIVPTCHRNDLLAKCLDCLAPGVQTLSAEQYEVIVSDDGSLATACEMIRDRYPWVKWVAGLRKGPAANRNNGAKYACGEWLAFTDDDCLPDPNWLSSFAAATSGSALALEGAIHPLSDCDLDLAECPINLTGGNFWSANIAVQRSLFEKIGGFNPNYPLAAHEDQDLHLRLSPLTAISFVPEAYVYHPVRVLTLKEAITRIPKRCAAWAYHVNTNRKALGFESNLSVVLADYKFHLITLVRSLKHLHFKRAFVAITMLVAGIPITWRYLLRSNPT